MRKFRQYLFSDQGMKLVNGLFFLSALLRNSGLILITYMIWLLYLAKCIKTTPSKTVKVVYTIFAGFAIAMIVMQLVFLRNSAGN